MSSRTLTLAAASFLAACLFPTSAFAGSFTILYVQNEIKGEIGSASTFAPLNQFFDVLSTGAISQTVHDTNIYDPDSIAGQHPEKGFSSASADFAAVAVSLDQTIGGAETVAEGIDTVFFTPDFSGALNGLLFTGDQPAESWFSGPRAGWTITDVTTNTVLWNDSAHSPGAFSQGVTDSLGNPLAPLVFSASDLYELQMFVQVGSNQGPDGGDMTTNLFALDVPEPSSCALLGCALIGLLSLARKERH